MLESKDGFRGWERCRGEPSLRRPSPQLLSCNNAVISGVNVGFPQPCPTRPSDRAVDVRHCDDRAADVAHAADSRDGKVGIEVGLDHGNIIGLQPAAHSKTDSKNGENQNNKSFHKHISDY